MLIIWDKIFGTFREEPNNPIHHYGLCKKIENPNPVNINFSEFGAIIKDLGRSPKMKDKFLYIFGPPGWSHDGSTKTARQLREELKLTLADQQSCASSVIQKQALHISDYSVKKAI
jgi:hypothetical protein